MTPNVGSINVKRSIKQAARMMRDLDVGMLPVLDGELPVGTLTDRDIAIRAWPTAKIRRRHWSVTS
ncbi:MAG: CBS domain-containing protein [Candidatus Thiodiazotropha sp.]